MGGRGYPPEFRRKVLDLVASGRPVVEVARDLGISPESIYTWRRQDRIDRGLEPGLTSGERAELAAGKRRISELETELAVHRRASELLKQVVPPKGRYAAIAVMAAEGLPVQLAARVLDVSESGYDAARRRAPSARSIRHAWLLEQIRAVHATSNGTYGTRRVHAELTLGRFAGRDRGGARRGGDAHGPERGSAVRRAGSHRMVAGAAPGPDRRRPRRPELHPDAAEPAVGHRHHRAPDREGREGKVYCAVVLDTYARRVVGWSIHASPTAALVTNALGMAIDRRRPGPGTVIHSDRGVQFGSWAFTGRAKASGLLPSMGSIADCFNSAMIESFWSRVQVELLNRRSWKTRIELANALFEYLEIWHNRHRRHSALGWLTPLEWLILNEGVGGV